MLVGLPLGADVYPVALHSILNRVNSIYSIFFLAYQDEQLRGRKKNSEEDFVEFVQVGFGRGEDEEEVGELGEAVGGPRAFLPEQGEVGPLEGCELILRLADGGVEGSRESTRNGREAKKSVTVWR